MWEAMWGKALILDNVKRRGFSLANRCFLCLCKEETVDHLLLHCATTVILWQLVFTLFRVSWVLPTFVKDALLGWWGPFKGKVYKKVW